MVTHEMRNPVAALLDAFNRLGHFMNDSVISIRDLQQENDLLKQVVLKLTRVNTSNSQHISPISVKNSTLTFGVNSRDNSKYLLPLVVLTENNEEGSSGLGI